MGVDDRAAGERAFVGADLDTAWLRQRIYALTVPRLALDEPEELTVAGAPGEGSRVGSAPATLTGSAAAQAHHAAAAIPPPNSAMPRPTRTERDMEEAGLVPRERPPGDRRVVLVHATAEGRAALAALRIIHRDGIRRHFTEHLTDADLARLRTMLEKVRAHARPLRPGRVSR